MPRGIYSRPSAFERFLEKYIVSELGCWEWIGRLTDVGYGQLTIGQQWIGAHRFAYEYFKGAIPAGLTIDHLCRNRKCVNPAHLELVTMKVNTLRGIGLAALNNAKTHCPHGHSYDDSNTYYRPSNDGRGCRICRKQATIKRKQKKEATLCKH